MKKKDVAASGGSADAEHKSVNLHPKKWPQMIDGYVEAKMVKCGKAGCRCAAGALHGPYFYRRSWSHGSRGSDYIRPEDLTEAAQACENYRAVSARIRCGRAVYKALLGRVRELI